MAIKQLSRYSLLLIFCYANINAMKQAEAAQKWALFVRTPAYPKQLEEFLHEAAQKTKKLESPSTIVGYERYRTIEYQCCEQHFRQGVIHLDSCIICNAAYNAEKKKVQKYIRAKDRENRIANALADVIDHQPHLQ